MKILFSIACGLLLLGSQRGRAQGELLLREVVSREYSLHVGGVEDGPGRELASREISVQVENGISDKQTVSRELDLLIDRPDAPPAVTGLFVAASPTGDSATLDWSAYNQWAIAGIQRFEIYYSATGSFTDISGRTPYSTAGAGASSITLTGLVPNQDHYFAVVAVDGQGRKIMTVAPAAAYILSPQVVSREFSLFIGAESIPPYKQAISREIDLVIADDAPPPPIGDLAVSMSATGESVQLDWSAYNQWRVGDINSFAIYYMPVPFSSVTGMTPYRIAGGGSTSILLEGLSPGVDHFFAVVPVDGRGNFQTQVSYSAAYVLAPQVISREVSLDIGQEPATGMAQAFSRELSIGVPDAAAPAPVTGVNSGFFAVTSTSAFGAVDLDWTAYPEIVQADVARYRIYVSNSYFENVSAMQPFATVQTGAQRHTLTGLGGGAILYFAVVAEDLGGNFNPAVRAFSAQSSISAVGEVEGLAGTSAATSLNFTWQAPSNTSGFLTGYRIYIDGALAGELPATAVAWSLENLAPGTGYLFRITTLDPFGGESSGVSFFASTLLANPGNVRLTAQGAAVSLLWNAIQPSNLVSRYDVYRSNSAFNNVSQAQLHASVPGPLAILGNFAEVSGQHFAVVAVNTLGAYRPEVISVEATRQSQTIAFAQPATGPLEIPLSATTSSGLPVVFSAAPTHIASVNGSTLRVHRGGTVSVTATQAGDANFWPASVSRTLRLPPVITAFAANGTEIFDDLALSAENVTLSVQALDAAGLIRADFEGRPAGAGNWTPWGSDTSPDGGWSVSAPFASLADGSYDVRVTVTAAEGHLVQRVNQISYALRPALDLSFAEESIVEGGTLGGIVSIQRARATPLQVTLASSHPGRVAAGPPLTIPAGQLQAALTLSAPQDVSIQTITDVRITASASGAQAGEQIVTLLDDDWPVLTLSLDRTLVAENAGPNAVIATVTRQPATSRALPLALTNSNPAAAIVPDAVVIPAGEASISFPISIPDDSVADGLQTAEISAKLTVDGQLLVPSPPVLLQITDNEGPRLQFVHTQGWIREGQSSQVLVRRADAGTAGNLVVALAASPADEMTVPATVTIPTGQTEATFTVQAVADGENDGSVPVLLNGSANGVGPAQIEIAVTDLLLPDLVVTNPLAPTQIDTEANFTVNYRIENKGPAPANGGILNRLLLSTDPVVGDDIVLGQSNFSTTLNPGVGFERGESVRAPRTPGTYWLIVMTDAGNAVSEILETNNTALFIQPITIGAAYAATVQTAVTQVPANTPILFTGSATKPGGVKVPHVMVNIHIRLGETERVIAAITNSAGDFSTTWTPLPGEGGDYEIGACHPGVTAAPTQDSFAILTAKPEFPAEPLAFDEGGSATITGTFTNPTNYALTGLALAGLNLPPGLTVQVNLSGTTLAPGQTLQAGVALTGATGQSGTYTVILQLTTDQGVTLQVPFTVTVRPLLPVLALQPSPLKASVLRGESKAVNFTISNSGGAATGPVDVLLPDLSWLQLASPGSLPSIPPGGSATVSLLLSPSLSQALTLHSGTMVIDPALGAARSLPFEFRVVSSRSGDLEVDVVDEAYFFTAAAPKVAGATVTLRDAISAETIATAETPADGRVSFNGVLEGWYSLEVSSPDHGTWKGNIYLNAVETNRERIFISRNWVKYSWTVEEIELEDRYKVTVESTFETNVPAPVLIITPAVLELSDVITPGQTKVVNFKLENIGFIAANHSEISFPSHPLYEVTPLIGHIGTISAKSSITVPVTVTRKAVARKSNDVPCGYGGWVTWDFICDLIPVPKAASIPASGAETGGNCGGGEWNPAGGDAPPGPVISGGRGSMYSSNATCADACFIEAAFSCALGFTPAGCAYSMSKCIIKPEIDGCIWAVGGCLANHPIVNGANCLWDFAKCAQKKLDESRRPSRDTGDHYIFDQDFRNFVPDVAAAWDRVEPLLRMAELHYGSKELVLAEGSVNGAIVMETWGLATTAESPGGAIINPAEQDEILGMASGAEIDLALVQRAIDRWNRTREYSARGIHEISEVPDGESIDFIDRTSLRAAAQAIVDAFDASTAAGYIDPLDEFSKKAEEMRTRFAGQGGVCAKVKIRLDQQAVMTRSAFRGTLELSNNLPDSPLTDVGFDLDVRDNAGNDASDLFNIQVAKLGGLAAIDGSGVIGAQSSGSAQWTLIPRDTAAPLADTVYTIGGTIRYNQGGVIFSIPVTPVPITVKPDAALHLKYFHQRDVFSDDPHTDPIEPSVPYALAVMVENRGAGAARNLSITSAQPEIVDNEKGLFIDFKIIGTEVAGQNLSPSLTANFGTVDPGSRKVATWLMTSTLQGLFIDYNATFEHLDGFGDERLSLIKEVEIHEMIRMIADTNGQPAFLTNDIADVDDRPDTVHLSSGGTAAVAFRSQASLSGPVGPATLSVTLATAPATGWTYLRIPDPGNGLYRLTGVTRSDGRVLPLDKNAWTTDRTFIGLGQRPIYEKILHLADKDSTGSYTLTYAVAPGADVTPPQSQVAALSAQSGTAIPLHWSGSDDQGVASYDIFVKTGAGPWERWLAATTGTSAIFTGQFGLSYQFYSVARDRAGNLQNRAATADASTTVALSNSPPVIGPVPLQIIPEGSSFALRIPASDPDGPAEALRYTVATAVPGITIDAAGMLRWVTGESDGGTSLSVTVTVIDGGTPAASASQVIQLSVPETNSPPRVAAVGPQTIEADRPLVVPVLASDDDLPTQTLGYSLAPGAPAGASINPLSGLLSWTPQRSQAGQSYAIGVLVTDSTSAPASARVDFSITVVAPPNRAPIFGVLPPLLWLGLPQNSPIASRQVQISATDPDGDPVTVSANLSALPGARSFQANGGAGTGILTWDTRGVAAGTYSVPLQATDGSLHGAALLVIRLEPDDAYWRWATDALAGVLDPALLAKDADPDGDGTINALEMALLRDPLRRDSAPFKITPAGKIGAQWKMYDLDFKRHRDSGAFVELWPEKSSSLDIWNRLAAAEWQFFIDPQGDSDGHPETEDVRWRVITPADSPRMFYRVEGRLKP